MSDLVGNRKDRFSCGAAHLIEIQRFIHSIIILSILDMHPNHGDRMSNSIYPDQTVPPLGEV